MSEDEKAANGGGGEGGEGATSPAGGDDERPPQHAPRTEAPQPPPQQPTPHQPHPPTDGTSRGRRGRGKGGAVRAALCEVKLYWSPSLRDHTMCVPGMEEELEAQEYDFIRVVCKALSEQVEGSIPLRHFWHPSLEDNLFAASAAAIEEAVAKGYTETARSPLCYILPRKDGGGNVAMFRHFCSERSDSLLVMDEETRTMLRMSEAIGAKYVKLGKCEGYAFPPDATAMGLPQQVPAPVALQSRIQGVPSPSQLRIIEGLWREVVAASDAAALFHELLFKQFPSTASLYEGMSTGHMEAIGSKMMVVMGSIFKVLGDKEATHKKLKHIAVRHVRYGVLERHYTMVGTILSRLLARIVGRSRSPPTTSLAAPEQAAWDATWNVVEGKLREAHRVELLRERREAAAAEEREKERGEKPPPPSISDIMLPHPDNKAPRSALGLRSYSRRPLRIGVAKDIGLLQSFTVAVHVHPDCDACEGNPLQGMGIVGCGSHADDGYLHVAIVNRRILFAHCGTYIYCHDHPLPDGKWTAVVCSFDAASAKMCVSIGCEVVGRCSSLPSTIPPDLEVVLGGAELVLGDPAGGGYTGSLAQCNIIPSVVSPEWIKAFADMTLSEPPPRQPHHFTPSEPQVPPKRMANPYTTAQPHRTLPSCGSPTPSSLAPPIHSNAMLRLDLFGNWSPQLKSPSPPVSPTMQPVPFTSLPHVKARPAEDGLLRGLYTSITLCGLASVIPTGAMFWGVARRLAEHPDAVTRADIIVAHETEYQKKSRLVDDALCCMSRDLGVRITQAAISRADLSTMTGKDLREVYPAYVVAQWGVSEEDGKRYVIAVSCAHSGRTTPQYLFNDCHAVEFTVTNASTGKTVTATGLMVHRGLLSEAQQLLDTISATLAPLAASCPCRATFTGHGVAGALAELLAVAFDGGIVEGWSVEAVHSFGSPGVMHSSSKRGTFDFATTIIHRNDPIPRALGGLTGIECVAARFFAWHPVRACEGWYTSIGKALHLTTSTLLPVETSPVPPALLTREAAADHNPRRYATALVKQLQEKGTVVSSFTLDFVTDTLTTHPTPPSWALLVTPSGEVRAAAKEAFTAIFNALSNGEPTIDDRALQHLYLNVTGYCIPQYLIESACSDPSKITLEDWLSHMRFVCANTPEVGFTVLWRMGYEPVIHRKGGANSPSTATRFTRVRDTPLLGCEVTDCIAGSCTPQARLTERGKLTEKAQAMLKTVYDVLNSTIPRKSPQHKNQDLPFDGVVTLLKALRLPSLSLGQWNAPLRGVVETVDGVTADKQITYSFNGVVQIFEGLVTLLGEHTVWRALQGLGVRPTLEAPEKAHLLRCAGLAQVTLYQRDLDAKGELLTHCGLPIAVLELLMKAEKRADLRRQKASQKHLATSLLKIYDEGGSVLAGGDPRKRGKRKEKKEGVVYMKRMQRAVARERRERREADTQWKQQCSALPADFSTELADRTKELLAMLDKRHRGQAPMIKDAPDEAPVTLPALLQPTPPEQKGGT